MSASSCWVTCGIITQFRARFAARDLLDARERLRLDRPVLREVDLGPGREVEPDARAAGRGRGHDLLHEPLHVLAAGSGRAGRRPATRARSTPSSRASLRTDGEAWDDHSPLLVARGRGRARRQPRRGRGRGRRRGGGCAAQAPRLAAAGCAGRAGAAAGAPAASRTSTRLPSLTRSPDLHAHLADGARGGRRHVHRRLLRLERDERIVALHRVAGLHEHVDDGHVLELADGGHLHLDRPAARRRRLLRGWRRGSRPRARGRAQPRGRRAGPAPGGAFAGAGRCRLSPSRRLSRRWRPLPRA